MIGRLLLALTMAGLAGCRKAADTQPAASNQPVQEWFQDITDQSGLHFKLDAGTPDPRFMPQIVGSGAALFDFDNDGRLDIYLIQNGGFNGRKNQLFHQEPDGHFKDVSAGSGLDVAGYGMGVAIGDVNNDGLPDVLLTEYGRVRLFLNNGNGTFTDVTKEAGLDDQHWATSASFIDYDRDGWLDLVICNYLQFSTSQTCFDNAGLPDYCGPTAFPGTVARLYHNLGRVGAQPAVSKVEPGSGFDKEGAAKLQRVRFEDVTVPSGLARAEGAGLGVVCLDFDGDGWPDIFITNDERANFLWINQHDGTFKEEALLRGLAFSGMGHPQANMGIAFGDTTGHGALDLFVTHLTEEVDVLWSQGPPGIYQDRTAPAGLAASTWRGTGFGDVLSDFDNDGAPDLAIVNGRVRRSRLAGAADSTPAPAGHWAAYAERNQLFANSGDGRFHDISAQNPAFCGPPAIGRALACGDLENRGAMDLLATYVAGPARLYRNVAPRRGHWLEVRAVEPAHGGRDACGATVTVKAGGRQFVGWAYCGGSYLSSSDPRVHFGLGPTTSFDAIEMVWPDGRRETFAGGAVDRIVVVREGGGKVAVE